MANDTKVAALLRPATQAAHRRYEEQIVNLLRHGPLTRLDIANKLEKGVNCVTHPVKELLDAGVIYEHERIRQPQTGNLAWLLKLKGEDDVPH